MSSPARVEWVELGKADTVVATLPKSPLEPLGDSALECRGRRDYFGTSTGGRIFLLDPARSDVRVFDLAVAQSRICRFGGHVSFEVNGTYSVAQHAVLVSHLLELWGYGRDISLGGLFHDAAEAVLGDVISPLKWLLGEVYKDLERRWELEIFSRFGVDGLVWEKGVRGLHPAIKRADQHAFELECFDLLPRAARKRALPHRTVRPRGPAILPLSPDAACVAWLRRFWELSA